MNMTNTPAAEAAEQADGALYRLVWRWHFFAGLVCLPVLVIMAITGALYLFRNEINDAVYPTRFLPQASLERPALPLDTVVERVLAGHPGALHQIELPQDAHRSLVLTATPQGGARLVLHVDPTDARVLSQHEEASQWDMVAKSLHSGSLLGRWASIAVEIIAGWCIVLIVSGTYLWWPRGQKGGVLSVRGSPEGRLWWRDLHAVTGILAGMVVLFLALTGMPWSEIWGKQFGAFSKQVGLGHPMHVWGPAPPSSLPMSTQGEVPWTFMHATTPASKAPDDTRDAHAAHNADNQHGRHDARAVQDAPQPAQWGLTSPSIGLDRAVENFAALGLDGGYILRMPSGEQGAYTALRFPQQAAGQHVAHLDQYSGRVLADIRFGDYGAIARGVEWGISVHKGQEYGVINKAVMLIGCLAVVGLAMSSVVMWWKRRPKGRLAAPPRKEGDRLARGAAAIALALGAIFPTLGASMLVAAALEWLWGRHRHKRHLATAS